MDKPKIKVGTSIRDVVPREARLVSQEVVKQGGAVFRTYHYRDEGRKVDAWLTSGEIAGSTHTTVTLRDEATGRMDEFSDVGRPGQVATMRRWTAGDAWQPPQRPSPAKR